MVVKRPRSKPISLNPLIPGIERVQETVILGFTISDRIGFGTHMDKICCKAENPCSRYVFWSPTVTTVNVSLTLLSYYTVLQYLARLLYASPVWWGFATVG